MLQRRPKGLALPRPWLAALPATAVFIAACSNDAGDALDAAPAADASTSSDAGAVPDAASQPPDAAQVSQERLAMLANEILDAFSELVDHACACEPQDCAPVEDGGLGLGPVTPQIRDCFLEAVTALPPTEALESDLVCMVELGEAAIACTDIHGCDEDEFDICMQSEAVCSPATTALLNDCLFESTEAAMPP